MLLSLFFSVLEKVRSKRQKHVVVVDSDGSEVENDSDEEAEEQERIKMAAEYKDQGNEHFKNGNFTEAVNCYTMAQEKFFSLRIENQIAFQRSIIGRV